MDERMRDLLTKKIADAGIEDAQWMADCISEALGKDEVERLKELPIEELIASTGDRIYLEMKKLRESLMHVFDMGVLSEGLTKYIEMVQKFQKIMDAYSMLQSVPIYVAERKR